MPTGVYDRSQRGVYPPELIARVCELYLDGYGIFETARLAGTTHGKVQKILPLAGVKTRPTGRYAPRAAPRRRGADHHGWVGDQVSYSAAHTRVRKARGTPQECSRCGATGPGRVYQWANLTGNYADVNDYARMCQSCHRRFDNNRQRAAESVGSEHPATDDIRNPA